MEEILKETAKQVPALVIMLVLSVAFARAGALVIKSFLAQLSETRADYLSQSNTARGEYLRAIERFHSDNLEARAANRATLQENTVAADKQSSAIHDLTLEVRELRSALGPVIRQLTKA